MARVPDLEPLCAEHGIRMCSVEQIIRHRLAREALVRRIEPLDGTEIELPEGRFRLFAWESPIDAMPHVALTAGGIGTRDASGRAKTWVEPVLVRMQRREILSDVFGARWNPTEPAGQDTVRASLRAIARAGEGALVYLRTEGTGLDLSSRLAQIRRPERDDVNAPDLTRVDGLGSGGQPMDARLFGVGGQILRDLGLTKLRILTNHPKPMPGLHGFGLDIVESVPIHA
jgi:3,4-dihydroxy 2-butanone 4-phosphate synthase/GTP cyclohydrolase II